MAELPSLKIGQLVNIEVVEDNGTTKRYPSRVEDMDAHTLTLSSPLKNRIPVYFATGSSVNIWYRDSLAAYTFSSSVIRNKNEELPMFVIKKPDEVKRVQKRKFVRVFCSINVLLGYRDLIGNEESLPCVTRDLSAGGMMLILPRAVGLIKDDDVTLRFDLNGDHLKLPGRVIRNGWEVDFDGIEKRILAVQFVEPDESAVTKITEYCYKRQIELRRKGLL